MRSLAVSLRRCAQGFALRGQAPLSPPVTHNLGAHTGVFVQYRAPTGSDGHFVVFRVEAARRQSTQFLGTLARTGAATLVEAGNLLMLPHHTRGEAWDKAAQRMSEAAQTALAATAKKDVDALFDSGAAIYNACSACHQAQRVGEDTPGADAAKAPPGTAPVNTK